MKTIIRKAYWNYEKEEKWLNEMSVKGLALTEYSWCRYVFADCQPGEFIYRIELLEHLPSHPESTKYINFMEENGVEHIASYNRWVYFRKRSTDGVFDIYSDIDSKIKHYQRIHLLWFILALAELSVGFSNIVIGFAFRAIPHTLFPINITLGYIVAVIGLLLLGLSLPLRKKIKQLRNEKRIRE